jgi:nucleosome binding factor SPN SPT16 subunit
MPFTVITMTEVNIVNLERVGFNLKNFDMTLVFKVPPPPLPRKPLTQPLPPSHTLLSVTIRVMEL